MNLRSKKLLVVSLAATLLSVEHAAAFYDPGVQRWANRDPIGDIGFRLTARIRFPREEANAYLFVKNMPTVIYDRLGLDLVPPAVAVRDALEELGSCPVRIKDEVWRQFGNDEHFRTDPNFHYGHCVASCRIQRECPGGRASAWLGGLAKEIEDQLKKWFLHEGPGFDMGDMNANREGRSRGRNCPTESCEEACRGTEG